MMNQEEITTLIVKSNIKLKCYIKLNTMIKSSLCYYSDAYTLGKGYIAVPNTEAADAAVNNTNKKVIFKNCASFTNCISEINNTHVDIAKGVDIEYWFIT